MKGRSFTGKEYLESLRDGREIYVYGEHVKDVTTHPAFRNAARSIARLYDALHAEKTKRPLTCPTDTGVRRLHPTSSSELLARRTTSLVSVTPSPCGRA